VIPTADPERAVSPLRRSAHLLAACTLVTVGVLRLLPTPEPAAAAVTHVAGYQGEVDGFGSWYGSYGMGALGTAWCIDHGSRAPDPAYGYAPTPVADHSQPTRTALAWILGRYGAQPDRVTSAALMLVAHDLMGARYPSGLLDVDRLSPAGLRGFGDDATAVADRARAIKADAVAHGHLVPPYSLTLEAAAPPPGTAGAAVARLRDGNGAGVAGIEVRAVAVGTSLSGSDAAVTAADGTATFGFTGALGPYRIEAAAEAPDLVLQAFASTTTRAQRVARAASVRVGAVVDLMGFGRGTLTILKRGDATPYLPIAGARFEVLAVMGDTEAPTLVGDAALVIGPDGRAGPVELIEGRYVVREATPPPGYEAAGPWTIDVPPGGEIVLEVDDIATRSALAVRKVDALTGAPVAGAVLAIHRDADGDGAYETAVAEVTSTAEPVVVGDLVPGRYRVTETAPPPGYLLTAEPVDVEVPAASTVEVVVADQPVPRPTTTTTTTTTAPTAPAPSTTPTTGTTAPPSRPRTAPLPRTGVDPGGLAATGAGLVLLGSALRRRPTGPV
jgi:hypothetical protein